MAEEFEYTREPVALPMNAANVAAMVRLLDDWRGDCVDAQGIAEHLASRGVLVPSALTDSDAVLLGEAPEYRSSLVADLERIARGEQP